MNCLLVIDIQNDFLPGGALAVPHGDTIIPVVNELMTHFPLVAATQDWHPPGHASFATSHPCHKPFEIIEMDDRPQKLWPDHCIQRSHGADLSARLDPGPIATIFRKGTDSRVDSYSGFFDNHRTHPTGLTGYLRGLGVTEIFLTGLAAEICVAYTAADGVDEGFRTTVIEDATHPLDDMVFAETKTKLEKHGVKFASSDDILAKIGKAA